MRICVFSARRALLQIICVVVALLGLAACDQDLEINQEFSVNVFKPGPTWPNVKKLPPEQKEAYERYGKPDCFHVYWTPDGAIKTKEDLRKELKGGKPKTIPPYSWIYLKLNKEVTFKNGMASELPLTDQIRIIAQNGDPEDVREDSGVTQWMFYSTGKIYKFSKGRVFETKEFPAMGKYLK